MVITSTALDTVTPIEPLHDGKTLVSTGGNFKLGFFSPGSSTRRYVGIWFKNISVMTYVWVANRETPLLDSFGVLQMTNQYRMKLGKNFVTGLDRFLTSWKSSDDPSPGSYTYRIDPTGYPQPFLLRDNVVQFRDGPWNGLWFSSTSRLPTFSPNEVEFVLNNREMYYVYDITNGGSGCLLWINTVIDVKVLSASGQDLYVKVPFSKLGGDKKKRIWISIRATLAVLTLMLLCGATLYILWRRRKSKANCNASSKISTNNNNEGESELPIYAFDVIAKATNDFSVYNKLGQGGFGPVYKAWTLFKEGTALDLADPLIQNSSYAYQLQRSIQIGLLCVQQHPEDRPSTSLIAVMLSSDCELLEPKEPGFYIGRCLPQESRSNDCTITSLLGR
ncbi:hypothetical protein BVRB_9g211830 [Beta vulgaris subsp. vulgaris]|nr:hypothetical protein BVRB_9g211830 [Beta vulgaris subsp. vulgaris]